jgi:hypothetical protein
MPDAETVSRALSDIESALRSDGYGLRVAVTQGQVHVSIEAGPSSCAECLVSIDLMTAMIESELVHHEVQVEAGMLRVTYPEPGIPAGPP